MDNSPDHDLRAQYTEYLRGLRERIFEATRFNPVLFARMVNERGGYETAIALLHARNPASGLATLWEKGRLDLSMESSVLQEPWSRLFGEEEKKIARDRLAAMDYTP